MAKKTFDLLGNLAVTLAAGLACAALLVGTLAECILSVPIVLLLPLGVRRKQ